MENIVKDILSGLFECDGGMWEVAAKENIAGFIKDVLCGFPPEISEHVTVIR